jgi:hypothetical protein
MPRPVFRRLLTPAYVDRVGDRRRSELLGRLLPVLAS